MNNKTISILVAGLVGFGAIAFSAYGAYHNMTGWGYFLVIGVIFVGVAASLGEDK